jgi:nucleotide-binding universal stress UspA family protein
MYRHVLAVTDGSRDGSRAVQIASDLASEHHARLTVASVVELERAGRHCGPGPSVWNDVLRDAARRDLLRAKSIVGMPANYEIFYGKPIEAVADGARELGCDVIVVPSSRRGLGRVLHRDRAAVLAERVDCTVIPTQRGRTEPSATLGPV